MAVPARRVFDFIYRAAVPASSEATALWIPHPPTDDFQTVALSSLTSPVPHTHAPTTDGANAVLHATLPAADHEQVFEARFRVERWSRHADAPPALPGDPASIGPELQRLLEPDANVPIDGIYAETARAIVEPDALPCDKARRVFDYLIETLEYDSRGCTPERVAELGNLGLACDIKRGTCTEFHGLYVSYARALGLPARFSFGFKVPHRASGVIAGYHCWAEVHLPGVGWYPVDVSEGFKRTSPKEREFYFGNLDADRVQFTTGRDVALTEGYDGGPVDKLIFPVARRASSSGSSTGSSDDDHDDVSIEVVPSFAFVDHTPADPSGVQRPASP